LICAQDARVYVQLAHSRMPNWNSCVADDSCNEGGQSSGVKMPGPEAYRENTVPTPTRLIAASGLRLPFWCSRSQSWSKQSIIQSLPRQTHHIRCSLIQQEFLRYQLLLLLEQPESDLLSPKLSLPDLELFLYEFGR